MPTQIQLRRGTDTQNAGFTGLAGEVTVNNTRKSLHVHDGVTAGGAELLRVDLSNLGASVDASASDATLNSLTTVGNVDVGGNLTVVGTTTFNGGTVTLGDAATDNVVFGADVQSDIIPDVDNTYTLGSAAQKWSQVNAVAGNFTGDVNVDGTFSVATNKLTVNPVTGDTAILGDTNLTGDLLVATDKFVVTASTGDANAAGTVTAAGFSGPLTGNVTGDLTGNSSGLHTGGVTVDTGNNISIAANQKIRFDPANDRMNLWLDATGGGGGIKRLDVSNNSNFILRNSTDDEVMFYAQPNGGCYLYHNGVQTITTRTAGANIQGELEVDSFLSTGDATIQGNLTVSGTTTTINTTELSIEDINITVAKNAADAAAANGGGITVAGADATWTYDAALDAWSSNKDAYFAGDVTVNANLAVNGTSNLAGDMSITGHVIPSTDVLYDLGTPTQQWRHLYLSAGSIYLANRRMQISNTGVLTINTDEAGGYQEAFDQPIPTNTQVLATAAALSIALGSI